MASALSVTTLFTFTVLLHAIFTSAQSQVCNNAAALCSRNYNNVTYLGAHDSPYVRNSTNSFTIAGNQFYTTLQQLDAGVRLVSAQVHAVTSNGQTQWRLCHSVCQLYDAGYLVDWLSAIRGWLERNRNEVITILLVNSDNADAATLGNIYQTAGLAQYSYQPSSRTQATSQWPTLRDMISQNKRVVNFVADLDPSTNQAAPYLLNEFTFVFENSYENVSPTSFSCLPDRPPSLRGNTQQALSGNYLPLMNHFRYDNVSGYMIPSVGNVQTTNAPSGGLGNLGDAAANCSRAYGRAPTFILTDFSNIGPAITTVDRLNGVADQTTGRLVLPNSVDDSMANPSPTVVQSTSATSSGGVSRSATGAASSTGSPASPSSSSSSNSLIFDDAKMFSTLGVSAVLCAISCFAWTVRI